MDNEKNSGIHVAYGMEALLSPFIDAVLDENEVGIIKYLNSGFKGYSVLRLIGFIL